MSYSCVRSKGNSHTYLFPVPTPSHQSEVKPILDTVSTENMQGYLTKLTAFNNRYYKSSTGKDASDYIYNTVSDVRLTLLP